VPLDKQPLASNVLLFHLGEERARANDPALLDRNGRNARTLVKNGPPRVTLVMLQSGGKIAPHRAAGPITVQVLEGEIQFTAAGQDHRLAAGDLLVLDAGVEHHLASETGGAFLLTVVLQPG
jgi:quercetin dioxygenase-like cupin family protein